MNRASDEQLARRAGRGERAAFETLLERHYERIVRVSTRITGSRTQGQDVAQEVGTRLARTLESFAGRARFTTWLYRVTVDAARDALHADAARGLAEAGLAEAGLAETQAQRRLDAKAQAEETAWAREALARLEPDLRATAVLVAGEGLRHREAGAALGVSEATVSWRMQEVRRRLARRWRGEAVA